MPKPIITLTTDFGTADHFVGSMKGAILSVCPQATIVDISHEVTPYQVLEAAFAIGQAYAAFPKRTTHVVVVDPGVGTPRRPILVEAAGHRFVAPDNGVLAAIAAADRKCRVRELTVTAYWRRQVSHTFHGRDIFAPVAAHLACGVAPSRLGPRIDDWVRPAVPMEPMRTGKRIWTGAVLKADRFGNLITNFHIDAFPALRSRPFTMQIGARAVDLMVDTFAQIPPGEVALVVGSTGYIEVCANQAPAARVVGCAAGSPVELRVG